MSTFLFSVRTSTSDRIPFQFDPDPRNESGECLTYTYKNSFVRRTNLAETHRPFATTSSLVTRDVISFLKLPFGC